MTSSWGMMISPQLLWSWDENITDLVSGIPLELSPIWEVNHEINLIDPKKRIHYRLLKCPEHFHKELSQKIERYTTAQWWVPAVAHQVVPMLCILKKSSKLWTVFNLQEQNNNTVEDVTPFPDQDIIHNDIARTAYQSKLNMSEVYEQICIVPEHVHKTVFATVLGTFRSQVVQMGDCNAPSMFQQLMTAIFCDCISHFIHVYLDDIFIFSCSIEEHEIHLGIIFQWLQDHHLFLSKSKVDLYLKRLECLSHIIDDWGIHADADKMQHICKWRHPRTFNNVQCFLGSVWYLAHYIPDISAYTTLLSGCVRNSHLFEWMPLLDKCFKNVKVLACRAPILKPINSNNPNPIWVTTDGSKAGVGAIYGQGPDWKTCQPAGFLSKKFSNLQQHYRTHEHETIAMLEALMKWEDKLLGWKFTLITDHKGLKFFETQKSLSDRQVQWWEFLSHFNFIIMHVNGVDNKVADCLSHYYENDTSDDTHSEHTYVNTDIPLGPDGELLPTDHYMELHGAATRWSKCLTKKQESCHIESEILNGCDKELPPEDTSLIDDVAAIASGNDGRTLWAHVEEMMDL